MQVADPEPSPAQFKPRVPAQASGVVVPHKSRWHQRIIAWLVFGLIRLLGATFRFQVDDRSGRFFIPGTSPAIYCVWHNRLAVCMVGYFRYIKKHSAAAGLAAMVSASRDGGLLAAVLEAFSVQPVRGSSSRRGRQALLELVTWAGSRYDLAITPDGPRGPRYAVQNGIIALAQLTGLPIVPVSYNLSSKLLARSWDRFQIPLPFSRCEMILEKPISIPRDASDELREATRLQLENTLKAITWD
jgi:lysophospholipid acyltransferase (LPLAT)-like uncharacterized protein